MNNVSALIVAKYTYKISALKAARYTCSIRSMLHAVVNYAREVHTANDRSCAVYTVSALTGNVHVQFMQ